MNNFITSQGKLKLRVTVNFGMEAVVKRELEALGFTDLEVFDRKIEFYGRPEDVARCNLWLRSAERVYIILAEFESVSFDELFERTKALPWPDILPKDANFPVQGRSYKSQLFSISDSQAIVKKAIVESMKGTYKVSWFEEDGDRYKLEVDINRDLVALTLDTSGQGLHKRGYRKRAGDAPLSETLAAGLIQLSFWKPSRTLVDPFCGSGTIPIEAAMIGRNIAPGLDRDFDASKWDFLGEKTFQEARQEAMEAVDMDVALDIHGSDIDKWGIDRSIDNRNRLGLAEEDISFTVADAREFKSGKDYGIIISNPPYGDRMGSENEIAALYRDFARAIKALETWSFYILSSEEALEKYFARRADRKRKLYNGRIKVDYYQFYGPRPNND